MDENGRCRQADADDARHPDTAITLDRAALTLLGAGRRTVATLPDDARVTIEGDRDLGIRILDAMAMTPDTTRKTGCAACASSTARHRAMT